jgi:CRISPR-associated protein Csb2
MRLFQALVATSAMRWPNDFSQRAAPALQWLELQPPPTILAPRADETSPYRLSVPNNAMDLVARAWTRGNLSGEGDANPATHKAMKTVQPLRLVGGDAVHYLWPLPDNAPNDILGHVEALTVIGRSLVALGWGIDLVVGNTLVLSQQQADDLEGQRWSPIGGQPLRVPKPGTLQALIRRHAAFLNRLPASGGFNPVPPLSEFTVIGYGRDIDPPQRTFAAFQLLRPEADGMRAYNPVRNLRRVVGMMRDATRRAAESAGWSPEKIARWVLGHAEARGDKHAPVTGARLAFIPIPSIEGRGPGKRRVVGAIRRIVISSFDTGVESELSWARRALSGQELIDEKSGDPQAILSLIPDSDLRLRDYLQPKGAADWTTVTPMVFPGYDDRHQNKADQLIRKAIRQAGFSDTFAKHAEVEWRKVGYLPGAELATRYQVPEYLKSFPRYHVRIRWLDPEKKPVPMRGPICLGGGRHFGLGLFAAIQ